MSIIYRYLIFVLCTLIFLIASSALVFRRLHDSGMSGWWYNTIDSISDFYIIIYFLNPDVIMPIFNLQ